MTPGDPWQQQEEHLHEQWVRDYEKEEKRMGRFAKPMEGGGKDFKDLDVGSYVARIYRIIDLGTQKKEWEGEVKYVPQVLYFFEVPSKTIEIEGIQKPLTTTAWLTNSMGEKANLRHAAEAILGRSITDKEIDAGFDQNKLLEQPCMISIVPKKKGGTRVGSIFALPDGVTCPPQFNQSESFWLDEFSQEQFDSLTDGLKRIIMLSPEYAEAVKAQNDPMPDLKDDVPF